MGYYSNNNLRGKLVKKNIILSFINKGLSIIIGLLLVSATIGYLNSVNYGIWITISSVVTWAGFFDLGIQHGFRNHLTKAISNGNYTLGKQLVSTSYALILIIYAIIGTVFLIINQLINWGNLLNIPTPNFILQSTFSILAICFVFQSVLNLIQTVLSADQRPAYAAMIYTFGQLCVLGIITILVKIQNNASGSLLSLAYVIGGIPILIFAIFSIILYKIKYKAIAPDYRCIRFNLTSKIMGLGLKFFLVQLSILLIFQSASVIITRNIGPESSTIFNVTYRYLGIIYMISVIILTPFWSAFTDAYEKRDYKWMRSSYDKLNRVWYLCIPIVIVLILISQIVYRIWLKNSIFIPWSTTIWMGVYMVCMSRGALFMFLINGIGRITAQMWIYICFAIISIPIMNFSSLKWGLNSIIIFGAFVYLIQAIAGQVQLTKILHSNVE